MNPFKIRLGISALLHFEVHADLQSTADCDLRRVAASIRRYGCSLWNRSRFRPFGSSKT